MIDLVDDGTVPMNQVEVALGMSVAIFIPAERRTVIGTVSIMAPNEIIAGVASLGEFTLDRRNGAELDADRESTGVTARVIIDPSKAASLFGPKH